MVYPALGLTTSINSLTKKLTYNFLYSLFIFILFVLLLYEKNKSFDVVFFVCVLLLFVSLAFIQYSQIVMKGAIVNKTAMEVQINDDEIIIKTIPFKVLFWIDRPAIELKFKLNQLRINKIPYKLKEIYDLKDYVIEISNRTEHALIILDYFEKALYMKLQEITGELDN